jgi:mono/diheme cytochrome c family protein
VRARLVRVGRLAWLLALGWLVSAPAEAGPELDYILHCQGCHRADGSGSPGAVPSLRGDMARFLQVPGGREYLVRVPGTAQSPLGDAETAALLNWMLEAFSPESLGAGFTPYTEHEVGRLRRPPLTDVETVRRDLMGAIQTIERGR